MVCHSGQVMTQSSDLSTWLARQFQWYQRGGHVPGGDTRGLLYRANRFLEDHKVGHGIPQWNGVKRGSLVSLMRGQLMRASGGGGRGWGGC